MERNMCGHAKVKKVDRLRSVDGNVNDEENVR